MKIRRRLLSIEAFLLVLGLAGLLFAVIVRKATIGSVTLSSKAMFYAWLGLTVLAIFILIFRGGVTEVRKLIRARRLSLAGVSVLIYGVATALFVWIEYWIFLLGLRAN